VTAEGEKSDSALVLVDKVHAEDAPWMWWSAWAAVATAPFMTASPPVQLPIWWRRQPVVLTLIYFDCPICQR